MKLFTRKRCLAIALLLPLAGCGGGQGGSNTVTVRGVLLDTWPVGTRKAVAGQSFSTGYAVSNALPLPAEEQVPLPTTDANGYLTVSNLRKGYSYLVRNTGGTETQFNVGVIIDVASDGKVAFRPHSYLISALGKGQGDSNTSAHANGADFAIGTVLRADFNPGGKYAAYAP
jgi:hypothetical protein